MENVDDILKNKLKQNVKAPEKLKNRIREEIRNMEIEKTPNVKNRLIQGIAAMLFLSITTVGAYAALLVYQSNNNIFSDSRLVAEEKNENYRSKSKEITERDFAFGEICCEKMKASDVEEKLGTPDEISDCMGEGYYGLNYVEYSYENMSYVFDKEDDLKLKEIYVFGEAEGETSRGIRIGDSYEKVLEAYAGSKDFKVYENNQGIYKILYGEEDFFDEVINEKNEKDATCAWIYEYFDGKVYSINYIQKGKKIRFDLDENECVQDICFDMK